MSASKPCQAELTEAYICTQVFGPVECGCFDSATFPVLFEQQTRQSFLATQAFLRPTDPGFCDSANQKVCDFYNQNQSCCCEFETEKYRKCLVETVLVRELPTPLAVETATCLHVCPSVESAESGSGSILTTVIAVGTVVVALAFGAFIYLRHRRSRASTRSTSPSMNKKTKKNIDHGSEGRTPSEEDIENGIMDKKSQASITSKSEEDSHKSPAAVVVAPLYATNSCPSKASQDDSDYEEELIAKQKDDHYKSERKAVVSKTSSTMDDKNPVERVSKAKELKKKRHAIESWNKEQKQGSTRSLEDYLSDGGDSDFDALGDDLREGKRREERREERRLRQRSSSTRVNLNPEEEDPATLRRKKEKAQDKELQRSLLLERSSKSSSSRSLVSDDGEKRHSSSSKSREERREARRADRHREQATPTSEEGKKREDGVRSDKRRSSSHDDMNREGSNKSLSKKSKKSSSHGMMREGSNSNLSKAKSSSRDGIRREGSSSNLDNKEKSKPSREGAKRQDSSSKLNRERSSRRKSGSKVDEDLTT